MKNFIIRTITSLIFVAIMLTCFLRVISMIMVFAIITGMTIWEFSGLVNNRPGVRINRFITTAAGVYLVLAVFGFCSEMTSSVAFIPYLLTIIYLFVSELYTRNEDAVNDWAYTMLSQMYIALPLSCISILALRATATGEIIFNPLLPLSVFIFLWVNDAGAYIVGSMIGKNKLFPRISPGKSWEGSIGGGMLVIVVALLLAWIDETVLLESFGASFTGLTQMQWVGLGLTVVFFGTWGDLVESLFKRTIGIKDSGNILPGHGGMLDRFDSSLMAIPAAVVYLFTIQIYCNDTAVFHIALS